MIENNISHFKLDATNSKEGVAKLWRTMRETFGEPGVDWILVERGMSAKEGKVFDVVNIELKNGDLKTAMFDITEYWGL